MPMLNIKLLRTYPEFRIMSHAEIVAKFTDLGVTMKEFEMDGRSATMFDLDDLITLCRGLSLPTLRSLMGMAFGDGEADTPGITNTDTKDTAERKLILTHLRLCNGNRRKAAKTLDIGLRTLFRKIKKYKDEGYDVPVQYTTPQE